MDKVGIRKMFFKQYIVASYFTVHIMKVKTRWNLTYEDLLEVRKFFKLDNGVFKA